MQALFEKRKKKGGGDASVYIQLTKLLLDILGTDKLVVVLLVRITV